MHRLGIGRATLGPGRHCAIRVPELAEEPALAGIDEVLLLEIATDGTVTVIPDDSVRDQEMPVPLRREPVTEPIVLEASSVHEEKRRRWLRRSTTVLEFELGERIDPADAVPLVHLDRRPLRAPPPGSPTSASGWGRCCSTRSRISPSPTPP